MGNSIKNYEKKKLIKEKEARKEAADLVFNYLSNRFGLSDKTNLNLKQTYTHFFK